MVYLHHQAKGAASEMDTAPFLFSAPMQIRIFVTYHAKYSYLYY